VLWHRTREEGQLKAVRDAASSLKFQVISLEVRNIPGDLDEAFRMATQQRVEALLVLSSPAFFRSAGIWPISPSSTDCPRAFRVRPTPRRAA
jgi:hypothetical protein